MKKAITILLTVLDQPDNTIFFNEPVIVRNERESLCECWAVAIAGNGLWVMDEHSDWHELDEQDRNYDLVVDALHTRLMEDKLKAA